MHWPLPRSRSGVKKTGIDQYEAVTGDPQFVYRFLLRRPRFMVVFVEAAGEYLDPRLYADRGNGFDERTSMLLNYAGPSILISVSEPRAVRAIRFDPCTYDEGKVKQSLLRAVTKLMTKAKRGAVH